jgi:hypothetical protein
MWLQIQPESEVGALQGNVPLKSYFANLAYNSLIKGWYLFKTCHRHSQWMEFGNTTRMASGIVGSWSVLAMNTCILISNECMDFDISSGDTTMFTK